MTSTSQTTKTTCPYCGVGCGVLVTKQADGTVWTQGDPDHPANFGRLCSKGSALEETLSLDDRLLFPEIGSKRASWDEALDLVADKFKTAIEENGPDSVAFYVSGQILTEDYYVANKLMKGYIGSANIDTNSRLCMASSVAGHRKAFGMDTVPGCYEDLEAADLVVLVGSNLAWCHPVIYQRLAAAKEARPHMKVVLVDPRRTMTADIADTHLAIKPDGDAALFNGLLSILSKTDKLDHDYITAHTSGFEKALEAAAALSEADLLKQTGLSADELDNFYTLFSNTQKVVTVYSQGVNQSACGTDKVSSIINCHLATGRIGREGMGPFSITGQPNAMGGREVGGLANMLAAHMNIEDESHREIVQTFWNAPTIADKQGLKAVDLFDAVSDGRIKALWIMATNPVDSLPNADKVEAAIKACPFVVVSDVLQETDTIRHAHVKLPATAWGEKDGTVTNSERRISRQRAFLPAPGETRADWWQFAEVAKRMGFSEGFNWRDNADVFREFAALSAYENKDTRDFDIGAYASVSTEDYKNLTPFTWPQKDGESSQQNTRFFANGNFYTPDRKARFVSVTATENTVAHEDRPFVLNTGRIRDQWHTMTRTGMTGRLTAHYAEPFAEIHPNDALSLEIGDADLIRLTTDHGDIIVRALITDRVRTGEVFVPMHWTDQFTSKGRVDSLIPPVTDPFSGQPASKNVAVAVDKFGASQFGFAVMREKPAKIYADYWSLAICPGGWRLEFAFIEAQTDAKRVARSLMSINEDMPLMSVEDAANGENRFIAFDDDRLSDAVYLAHEPVAVSRSLVIDWLQTSHSTTEDRLRVLAGRASSDMPDKGAIVCSCFSIGANQITNAAIEGAVSVAAIGEVLSAGTNCGSCKGEISALLSTLQAEAAE